MELNVVQENGVSMAIVNQCQREGLLEMVSGITPGLGVGVNGPVGVNVQGLVEQVLISGAGNVTTQGQLMVDNLV